MYVAEMNLDEKQLAQMHQKKEEVIAEQLERKEPAKAVKSE